MEGSYVVDHESYRNSIGLLRGHSYTLLRIEVIDGFLMLNFRNPWGVKSALYSTSDCGIPSV